MVREIEKCNHVKQILISLDQLANTVIFGGWADETISARSWRKRSYLNWGRLRRIIDFVAQHIFRQKDHCHTAWLSEFEKHQLPPAYRNTFNTNKDNNK